MPQPVTVHWVEKIKLQKFALGTVLDDVATAKVAAAHSKREAIKCCVANVLEKQPPAVVRAVEIACDKGVSAWLTALPTAAHGFDLSKSAFRDSVRLRYGWSIPDTPSTCVCVAALSRYPTLCSAQQGDFLVSVTMRSVTSLGTF